VSTHDPASSSTCYAGGFPGRACRMELMDFKRVGSQAKPHAGTPSGLLHLCT
jgi:hypothetical protein